MMNPKTFVWTARIGAMSTAEPKVNVIKFGDGYEQRIQRGLQHDLRTYTLTFNGLKARMMVIDAFLTEHRGYVSFSWRPPSRIKPALFVCERWSEVYLNAQVWELTAEFREVLA